MIENLGGPGVPSVRGGRGEKKGEERGSWIVVSFLLRGDVDIWSLIHDHVSIVIGDDIEQVSILQ